MGVETHKVEVVPVVLVKHPNADKLSVVKVYNFQVVVNTADWEGVTMAAYVQPDSVMPDTPEYRFLKITGNVHKELAEIDALEEKLRSGVSFCRAIHADGVCPCNDKFADELIIRRAVIQAKIDANTKYLRITVRKLRGIISMGMLLPAPEGSQIGDDVAEKLGITHYEPPTIDEIEGRRKHTGDDVASPPPMIYAPKYDVESVYKYADCFEAGEPVYVSEKLDGQNGRYVSTIGQSYSVVTPTKAATYSNYHFHAGSRTEWKKEEGGSNWWRVIDQNPWIKTWMTDNPELVLYGEVFGWVQPLKYGAKSGQLLFRAFDIMEGTEYWDAEKFLTEVPAGLRVPDLGIMPFDFEHLQGLADGNTLIPGANHMREGIVIKPLKERKHWKLGRVMLKMVSNAYLEKASR